MLAISVGLLTQCLYYCKPYYFFKYLCFLRYEDITGRNYHFIAIIIVIAVTAVKRTISFIITTEIAVFIQNHIHFPCLEDGLSRTYQFD